MANRIRNTKITKAMRKFEKNLKKIHQKIDRQNNLKNDYIERHYKGRSDDGSRCWSF
jgi:hypothetical protein